MPYKERLKSGNSRKRKKGEYKVTNWNQYNQSLRKRGKISLHFPKGNMDSQFINDEPYERGLSGRLATYKQAYIGFIYILYRLFGWGLRQISGYIEDLWSMHDLKIAVPSFGHLSDLFGTVPIRIKLFCQNIRRRIESGEEIDLIADSTGLRFGKAGHWYKTKYNKSCDSRPWKKLHISMDTAMNIHEAMITPVILPPRNAVGDLKNPTSWHNKIVQYIKTKGTIYAFHKKYNYGRRDLAELQNSRIKRCISNSLLTQRVESQIREGRVIANIINLWNSFGQCNSVKIG